MHACMPLSLTQNKTAKNTCREQSYKSDDEIICYFDFCSILIFTCILYVCLKDVMVWARASTFILSVPVILIKVEPV